MPPSLSPTTTVTEDHNHVDHDDGRTRKNSTSPSPSPSLPYLNDPTLRAPVTVQASSSSSTTTEGGVEEEERDRRIIAAARAVCPGFFLPPDGVESEATVHVRPLSGGLSNALFVLSTTTSPDDANVNVPPFVLARVHFDDDEHEGSSPSYSDALVDREREVGVMCHLSRSGGLAPKMYGRFVNGRIEEFYDGYRPLSPSEMKDDRYWTCIGSEMGRFHRHTGVPPIPIKGGGGGGAECWDRVDGWFSLASKLLAARHNGNGGGDARLDRLDVGGTMLSEWEWLKARLTAHPSAEGEDVKSDALRFARHVVFCHMDCQSLNILVPSSSSESSESDNDLASDGDTGTHSDSSSTVRFIDFEYAGYNPRASDVANTFCECCEMNDLRADWSAQYPTASQQDDFLRTYVRTVDPDLALRLDGDKDGEGGESSSSWDVFLAELREEVGRHALISHLGWAVWSVVQALTSPIEYDFVAYAEQRMDGYRYFKGRYFR